MNNNEGESTPNEPKKRSLKSGHTYILAYPTLKLLKIGQSVYYAERLDQVQNMSPVETEVICALVGLHHERQLHNRFAHLRRRGEFFEDTAEIREYVLHHADSIPHDQAAATCNYTRNRSRRRKDSSA